MVKKVTLKKDKKLLTITVAALALSVASLIIGLYSISSSNQLLIISSSQTDNIIKNFSRTSQITFCYDNNIKPCDDISIGVWNKNNPHNTFNSIH